ncbi:MAG: hypothetical protein KDD38_06365, partial [Bdellovibrionales bacterium]|nr:hypothetical protein [Bdellovibrionales bacterium]
MKELKLNQLFKLSKQMITDLYFINKRPWQTRSQIESYQLEQIRKIVGLSKNYVSHYKDLPHPEEIKTLSDVAQLPLLTKEMLLSHAAKEKINKKYKLEDLIVSQSSGSTGQALEVYYDEPSFNYF